MSTPLWNDSGLSTVGSMLPRSERGSSNAPLMACCASNGLIGHGYAAADGTAASAKRKGMSQRMSSFYRRTEADAEVLSTVAARRAFAYGPFGPSVLGLTLSGGCL